jgi:hypothetical protein
MYNLFRSRLSSSSVHHDVTFASESVVPAGLQLHLCCLTTTEKLHRRLVVGPVEALITDRFKFSSYRCTRPCPDYNRTFVSYGACLVQHVHRRALGRSSKAVRRALEQVKSGYLSDSTRPRANAAPPALRMCLLGDFDSTPGYPPGHQLIKRPRQTRPNKTHLRPDRCGGVK